MNIINLLKQNLIENNYYPLNKNIEQASDNIFSYTTSEIESILSGTSNGNSFNLSVEQLEKEINGNVKISSDKIEEFLETVESMDEFQLLDLITGNIENQSETKPEKNIASNKTSVNNSNSSNASGSSVSNLSNLSLTELESKQKEQSNKVKEEQDNLNKANNGETESIKTAQADCDDKKAAYEEALENDENVSDELKSRQQENQSQIDDQKTVIDDLKSDISEKENEITDLKTTISADESEISALQSAISSLSSQTSDDESVKADIASKLSAARSALTTAQAKLSKDKQALQKLEEEKTDLESELAEEEGTLGELEEERTLIEAEILENCGEEVKLTMAAFKEAETNVEAVKNEEITVAQNALSEALSQLDEINNLINTKNTKTVEKEYSVNSLENPEQLYESMELDEKGLNYEVFRRAIEGYNNLEDKGNGFFGIFDTTQETDAERFYLLDLNKFEFVCQCEMKTGSGNMDDVAAANKEGSHATLSGFEKIGQAYNSSQDWDVSVVIEGLENGINDRSAAKQCVARYTTDDFTLGSKGISPVYNENGEVDKEASANKVKEIFTEGTILFTYPTDENYWELSNLYNTEKSNKTVAKSPITALKDTVELYKTMGLKQIGLSYKVFRRAIEGYGNLQDKGNGYLGIFDTTQSADAERYYLINLNNLEVVGQSVIKTGSGNMDDVEAANVPNSGATLSGFEKIAEEYISSKDWKVGIRIDGLEEGINDNAREKYCVAHYTTKNYTLGCKGIEPVYNDNGSVNEDATFAKLRKLFPTDSILFTYPTDEDYWDLSKLYA